MSSYRICKSCFKYEHACKCLKRASGSLKRMVRPCDEACLKCGSKDIHRKYRKKGERWSVGDRADEPFSKFINADGWWREAVRDCITHHCRTCQYDWQSRTLRPNAPHELPPTKTL